MCDDGQVERSQQMIKGKAVKEPEKGGALSASQLRVEAVRIASGVDPENLITKAEEIYKFLESK